MSPTDNVIHLVLLTCYNILNGAASKIDVEMHALSWCIKSPMTRCQFSKSDRLSPHLRHSRNMHSQSYQVPLCRTQQRKASFSPQTIVDWNRLPQTAVLSDSVESFKTAITILSLNSLPVLYIILNLFSDCTFFSFLFFLFRNAIPSTWFSNCWSRSLIGRSGSGI